MLTYEQMGSPKCDDRHLLVHRQLAVCTGSPYATAKSSTTTCRSISAIAGCTAASRAVITRPPPTDGQHRGHSSSRAAGRLLQALRLLPRQSAAPVRRLWQTPTDVIAEAPALLACSGRADAGEHTRLLQQHQKPLEALEMRARTRCTGEGEAMSDAHLPVRTPQHHLLARSRTYRVSQRGPRAHPSRCRSPTPCRHCSKRLSQEPGRLRPPVGDPAVSTGRQDEQFRTRTTSWSYRLNLLVSARGSRVTPAMACRRSTTSIAGRFFRREHHRCTLRVFRRRPGHGEFI